MTCESCKQQVPSRTGVVDFKRLTLLNVKYDRTRPFGHQALERLYSCCNCGMRWHVALARKWPTDPLPGHDWWAETPSSTVTEVHAKGGADPTGRSLSNPLLFQSGRLRRVRKAG